MAAEVWVRVTLTWLQPDFSKLLRLAQPHSDFLKLVRIVSSEFELSDGMRFEHLVILVPESYPEYWEACGDGIKMEYMAEVSLFSNSCTTLEWRGCLPAPDWDWPAPTP